MRIATCLALFLSGGLLSVRAQQAGMQNVWDIHNTLAAIALYADRLAPFVDQIHPENWNGARRDMSPRQRPAATRCGPLLPRCEN